MCIILSLILSSLENDKNNKNKKIDYLDKYENDLVKKGEYDSFSFEEEELEDDDYYSDDE